MLHEGGAAGGTNLAEWVKFTATPYPFQGSADENKNMQHRIGYVCVLLQYITPYVGYLYVAFRQSFAHETTKNIGQKRFLYI